MDLNEGKLILGWLRDKSFLSCDITITMADVEWHEKKEGWAGRWDCDVRRPDAPNPAIHFLPSRRPPDYAPLDTLNLTIGRTNFLNVTCLRTRAGEKVKFAERKFGMDRWMDSILRRNDQDARWNISVKFF